MCLFSGQRKIIRKLAARGRSASVGLQAQNRAVTKVGFGPAGLHQRWQLRQACGAGREGAGAQHCP